MGKKVDDREVATAEELIQDNSEVTEESFELKNGKIVWIKPLNRKQALKFRAKKMPRDVFEQILVSMAMVEPQMTRAQIAAWQESDKADGNLHRLTNRISEISGMTEKVEVDKDGDKSKD